MHLQISECFCFGTRQKGFVFSNFPKQKCWKVTDVNENIFETLLSHQKLAICLLNYLGWKTNHVVVNTFSKQSGEFRQSKALR